MVSGLQGDGDAVAPHLLVERKSFRARRQKKTEVMSGSVELGRRRRLRRLVNGEGEAIVADEKPHTRALAKPKVRAVEPLRGEHVARADREMVQLHRFSFHRR